jgi:O-acetyl-ADP-ribose deacetylase (regulator of RNase III)
MTTGGRLKAKYVIHTVGPVWRGGNAGEGDSLRSAYQESLRLASGQHLTSISFPSISTGAYGYPVEKAADIALGAVADFLKQNTTSLKEVVFVLFDRQTLESYQSALISLPQA